MEAKIIRENQGRQLRVLGDYQTLKLTGRDTSGQLAVIMQTLPAGIVVPMHVHKNEDENFHIIEGEVEFEIGDNTVILKEGDMVFLPRDIPHSIKVNGTSEAQVRINIVPAGIEAMFQELNDLPARPPEMAKVLEICARYGVSFL